MSNNYDLKEILNSEAAEIARKIDSSDGYYDGMIDVDILNKFLLENGYKKYDATDGRTQIPYIDVAKMLYNLKRESSLSGSSKIKVDFDPVEELRKAKKQYENWR